MNKKEERINTSYLSFGFFNIRERIHRDYLAHCLRYSHITRFLLQGRRGESAHVLDVGCGREVSLMRLMYSSQLLHVKGGTYTAVDYGPINRAPDMSKWRAFNAKLIEHTDFVEWKPLRKSYDVIVSFEMMEHVEALHAFHMLQKMRELVAKGGDVFVSTPCYSPKMGPASVHVNEMSHLGFMSLILMAGFEIVGNWGTFASRADYKAQLEEDVAAENVFERLSGYYESNVVACVFAPLWPAQARNNLWHLRRRNSRSNIMLPGKLADHGSSKRWPADYKKICKEVGRATS